jgi:hypothetical protein
MNREEKIIDFRVETLAEDRKQPALREAGRLAGLSSADWNFQLAVSATRFGISVPTLKAMVTAIIRDREKQERKEKAEHQRQELRAEQKQREQERQKKREQERINKESEQKRKQKQQAFAALIKLPSDQHEAKLAKLAERFEEDVATVRAELSEFCDAERSSAPTSEWHVEPWSEPVVPGVVLQELMNKINRHVILKPHEALAVALWILMSWIHDQAAHHSAYLVATSAEDSAGKTTLIVEVVGRLAPKAYSVGEPTAAIFRFIDHEKPTLIVDDADTLFQRKRDLAHIFNVAWTRGTKIPRHEASADTPSRSGSTHFAQKPQLSSAPTSRVRSMAAAF